jgi:DNA polymerase III epsilon subunit-like protein
MAAFSLTEPYVSVDVETSGPSPSQYSLLSIGACLAAHPDRTFYVELKPVNDNVSPLALDISGLSIEELKQHGAPPEQAMRAFEEWLQAEIPAGEPVFVGFNAPFDWMFVCDYFHRFLGRNPFGYSALDIKALYMGLTGVPWTETKMRLIGPRYAIGRRLTHHALTDALDQAELFRKILDEIRSRAK